MPPRKTKLADIADLTGLSTASVSRVLNGRGGVSASTRDAVIQALDELGYERPLKLSFKSTKLVGLITPSLDNPIYPLFAQILSTALARHDLTPILCPVEIGGVTEDEYVTMLLDHQVAGIIFIAGLHADTEVDKLRYQRLIHANIPIVLVNGFSPEIEARFVSDDEGFGIALALEHLAAFGHTQIGLVTGPRRLVSTQRRMEAFTDLMSARGVAAPADYIASSLVSVEGGQEAAGTLLDRGCTALVCSSDYMALGAIRAAKSRKLSVPGDVSIIGYDDSSMIGFTHPALTTLRQSVFAMGHAIVTIMDAEIQGASETRGSELLFRPELVVRESTGLARSRA
ncbi:MAG: LacI family DNA-binding transcriptional regulator [Arachnia sp.]